MLLAVPTSGMGPLSGPFDPTYRFSTSWLLPPSVLFFIRALFSLYSFTTIFFAFGWDGTHKATEGNDAIGHTFSYFTYLTYWGLSFYFLFAALHTGSYWLRGRPLLAKWPRALQEMHSILYTTIVVFPFLVTIVFWSLIYSGPFKSTYRLWLNISIHACNSVYALFETVIARTEPLPWWHLAPLILFLGAYLGVAYITHAVQGWWVYGFLDDHNGTQRGKVAGYCVGIFVAAVVIHFLVHWIIWLRVWAVEKRLGMMGRRSKKDVAMVRPVDHVEMAGGGYPALK